MNRKLAVLAAGGTGGHMFPAQALAEELTQRGWRIVLATDERGALPQQDQTVRISLRRSGNGMVIESIDIAGK